MEDVWQATGGNGGLGCGAEVEACLRRICSWRVPPNWSAADWFEEIRSTAVGAAWKAKCEFDFSRGISLDVYVHSRMLSRALARYRQEWSYGLHCLRSVMEEAEADSAELAAAEPDQRYGELWELVILLEPAQRRLVIQIFSEGRTEMEIARELGLSQRGVSKRKQAALDALRRALTKHARGNFPFEVLKPAACCNSLSEPCFKTPS